MACQANEARHADDQIGDALDQRQRQRRLGRNAEDRAQHDQAALLRAERAGDCEGRAAHRMHQAFDDDGIAEIERISHRIENDEDLDRADEPADKMPRHAADQTDTVGIERIELRKQLVDRAEHQPLAIAGKQSTAPS